MIKPEELRLGNYIAEPYNNIPEKVYSIKNDTINDETTEYFNPIPLTEDWLSKFGFVKMDEKYNFFIHGHEINFKVDKKIKWAAWCNTVLTNVEIQHVHQLQNVYFALTGKELEYEN